MGTAATQGELWGARAEDWARVQEPAWRPVYEEILARAAVGRGTALLDIGCGAGGALEAGRRMGAEVAGLDASAALVAIARDRLPGARIEIGEMEALPFDDAAFDVVSGFNSFQFAADIAAALREARRVCRGGGKVVALVWGRREECELVSGVMPAILGLLPPSPNSAPAPFDFASPGVVEGLMEAAGLRPHESGDLGCVFEYPDEATAIRAISSAGPSARAIRHAGEDALTEALREALRRFERPDGSVALRNRFRWVVARRA